MPPKLDWKCKKNIQNTQKAPSKPGSKKLFPKGEAEGVFDILGFSGDMFDISD